MSMTTYDVVVIGGGAAGLSGATALGRSRRSVLVVDAGHPRNAPAAGVHNFLTRDGIAPAELVALGQAEVRSYGGEITTGEAVSARRDGGGFVISLADGRETSARRLLVASGLVDQLPDLPGVRELWGHDVLHCPYCHGWEVRDQPIGVLAASPMSMHQALMFRQLSDDVIYFRHDAPDLTEDQAEQLAALGVPVVTERVVGLELTGGRLSGVRLADGSVVPRAALTVAPQFVAHSPVLESLGLPAVPDPRGMGSSYLAEPTGLTAVPGVYVAGNVADLTGQVVTSAGQGLMAGAMINADLIAEDAAAAVAAHRQLVGAR